MHVYVLGKTWKMHNTNTRGESVSLDLSGQPPSPTYETARWNRPHQSSPRPPENNTSQYDGIAAAYFMCDILEKPGVSNCLFVADLMNPRPAKCDREGNRNKRATRTPQCRNEL